MSKRSHLQKLSRFAISVSLAAVVTPAVVTPAVVTPLTLCSAAAAQGSQHARPLITQHIDEGRLTTLAGNIRSAALNPPTIVASSMRRSRSIT